MLNLLEKTEICIKPIELNQANLSSIAAVTAKVLGIEERFVQVIDVRSDSISLDILAPDIKAESVYGKGRQLLENLSKIQGASVFNETNIHSQGILGYLCLDEEAAKDLIKKTSKIESEVINNISKRAIVFPSGFEVQQGMIEDTNTPFLISELEKDGFKVVKGEILPDDINVVETKFNDALNKGYGIIISTGGVGAEDKDFNIEGLMRVIPSAYTPYIIRFTKGEGRHKKDGVRIGVGRNGLSTIINLPGPHEEVKTAYPVIKEYINNKLTLEEVSEKLALVLKRRWQKHNNHESEKH